MVGHMALTLKAPRLTHLVLGEQVRARLLGCLCLLLLPLRRLTLAPPRPAAQADHMPLLLPLVSPRLVHLDLSFGRLPLVHVSPLLEDLGQRLPPDLEAFSLACNIAPAPGVIYTVRPWLATPLQRCARLQTLAVKVSGRGWAATAFSDVLHGALGASPAALRSLYAERMCSGAPLDYGGGSGSEGEQEEEEEDICDGFSGTALDSFACTFPFTQLHIARRM